MGGRVQCLMTLSRFRWTLDGMFSIYGSAIWERAGFVEGEEMVSVGPGWLGETAECSRRLT